MSAEPTDAAPQPVTHVIGGGPATSAMTRDEIMKVAERVFEQQLKPYAYFALLMATAARTLREHVYAHEPDGASPLRQTAKLIETALYESGLMLDGRPEPRSRFHEQIRDPLAAAERIVAALRK